MREGEMENVFRAEGGRFVRMPMPAVCFLRAFPLKSRFVAPIIGTR